MLRYYKFKLIDTLIFIFFLFLTLCSAIAVIIIAKSKFQNNYLTLVCDIVLIISYTISLVVLIYQIFYKSRVKQYQIYNNSNDSGYLSNSTNISNAYSTSHSIISSNERWLSPSDLQSRESNIVIYSLISVLGIGDSIFNLTRSSDQLFAIVNEQYNSNSEKFFISVSLIENFLKFFNQLVLLLFIIYHKDYECVYSSKSWLKWFIGYLSILCLIQWIFIILQEIFQEHGYYRLHIISKQTVIKYNLTSFYIYEPFLYPLGIEFRICSFIELLFIFLGSYDWLSNKYNLQAHHRQSIQEYDNKNSQSTRFNHVKCRYLPFNQNTITFLFLISSIFLLSITIVIMLFQYSNLDHNSHLIISIVHELCEMIILVFMILVTLCGNFNIISNEQLQIECTTPSTITFYESDLDNVLLKHITYKNRSNFLYFTQLLRKNSVNTRDKLNKKIEIIKKIDFLFLYISFAFLTIHCSMTILAIIIMFTYNQSSNFQELKQINEIYPIYFIITLITSCLTITQISLQLHQMWFLAKKSYLNKKYMNVLVLLNLTFWLFDTFSSKNFAKNFIQLNVYGSAAWDYFAPIYIPLAIFFRFHSCIILIKIKYEKYLFNFDD